MPRRIGSLLIASLAMASPAAAADQRRCGSNPMAARDARALHRLFESTRGARASSTAAATDRDVDDVAILEDHGDLVALRNPLDLAGRGVRLRPTAAGGFVARAGESAYATGSNRLVLGDDDVVAVELPFAFRFFGAAYLRAYVHSDGSLTFGSGEPDAGERSLGRLLAGPARIAPFFADLAPGSSGTVATSARGDAFEVSWDEVPRAGSAERNSFRLVLHADGGIDFDYGSLESPNAVVGVAPGADSAFHAVDLSAGAIAEPATALVERFSTSDTLDLVSAVRRFLAGHPDSFEQVVVYTTRPLNPQSGSLAFEVNVRNEVSGIGLPIVDDTAAWGSAGALASVVYMDTVDAYRDVDGFEILGHEVGHRWLARLRLRDQSGPASDALLGRGGTHWSFFLDSDASVLEGNDIADAGRGLFETTAIARGYSALDLYAMGLAVPEEVPPFFYVAAADDFQPARTFGAGSSPELGVSFSGVRRDATIDDVLAAMGPRVPSASRDPQPLRQAFVLVADAQAEATPERVATLARIRSHFGPWYATATRGRGVADSTLP